MSNQPFFTGSIRGRQPHDFGDVTEDLGDGKQSKQAAASVTFEFISSSVVAADA